MKTRTLGRIAFVLLLAAQIAGCGEGRKMSFHEAKDWFPTAKPHLVQVVKLVESCRPSRGPNDDYSRIWVDDDSGGARPAHCRFGLNNGISAIKGELKKIGVLSVDYAPEYGQDNPITLGSFLLYRAGLGVSGASVEVRYYSSAQACTGSVDKYQESQPLTTAPCHWFWERSLS